MAWKAIVAALTQRPAPGKASEEKCPSRVSQILPAELRENNNSNAVLESLRQHRRRLAIGPDFDPCHSVATRKKRFG